MLAMLELRLKQGTT